MSLETFIKKFKIPEVAYPYINKIFKKEEINFVNTIEKDIFTKQDIEDIIISNVY